MGNRAERQEKWNKYYKREREWALGINSFSVSQKWPLVK